MLTFAFDASGDERTTLLSVAGFVSSAEDWKAFSEAWTNRLTQEGIECFHAVDANAFRGEFEPFRNRSDKVQWRERLFSDLMDILKRNVYRKFACTVINKDFHQMSEPLRQEFSLSAYSLAGRTCEKQARQWALEEWKNPEMAIGLVFEAGDRGYGKLQERLTKEKGCIPPTFRPKKDRLRDDGTIEPGFVPLQAADWLAWEVNRATQTFYEDKLESEDDVRWPMQEFLMLHGYMGVYTPENIQDMEANIDVTKRITDWQVETGLIKAARGML